MRLAQARDRLGLDTTIVWNFLVFRWNEHEVASTRRFCQSLGIVFNEREAFVGDPDWLPSYRRRDAGQAEAPEPVSEAPAAAVTEEAEGARQPAGCGWHYSYTMVNADGAVSPCCAPWEDRHDFGKLASGATTFANVWNNERYQKARGVFSGRKGTSLPKVETICDQCPFDTTIQNLYSGLDVKVVEQFHRVRGLDPTLARAFALLDDPQSFVDFYPRHFEGGQLRSVGRGAESTLRSRVRYLVPWVATRWRGLLSDTRGAARVILRRTRVGAVLIDSAKRAAHSRSREARPDTQR